MNNTSQPHYHPDHGRDAGKPSSYHDDYVSELQYRLYRISGRNSDIPKLTVDGIYGEKTKMAVSAFQRAFGLPVTGTTDLETWERIGQEYELILGLPIKHEQLIPNSEMRYETLRPGSTGQAVRELQTMINVIADAYRNINKIPVTGYYDSATSAAVGQLQHMAQLKTDGVAGEKTWRAIDSLARAHSKQ